MHAHRLMTSVLVEVTSVAGHFGQPPSEPAATQADAKEVQSLYSETIGRNGQKNWPFWATT